MKAKGCLILGYAASASGYVLGAVTAVRRMLSGVSATELMAEAAVFFPSFSPTGVLSLTGLTLTAACAGLSATGIATALPCAAAVTYFFGIFSAAAFAAFGISGLTRFLWAVPLMAVSFLLISAVSGDALRGSFFTLRRLGLIREAKGQYADSGEAMDVPRYILTSCLAVGIAILATLYGHFASEHIFYP